MEKLIKNNSQSSPPAGGFGGQAQHQNKFDAGQAMVEAIVAMSIIVIGLLGAFALSSNSISLNRVAADRYVAVNLAAEGIELVKNLIDNSIEWGKFLGFDSSLTAYYEIDFNDAGVKPIDGVERPLYFSKDGSGYYAYNDNDLSSSYLETTQDFTRIVRIEYFGSSDHIKITSTVSWKAKDGSDLVFFVEDHFYNLKDFE